MAEISEAIAAAEQPIVIVGGPRWSPAAQEAVQTFALRFDLPVAAAFRAQDYIDNCHPSYCGHIGINMDERLATAIRASDLILVLGAPLDEIGTAGWSIIASPVPTQRIFHVHPAGTDPRDGVRVAQQIIRLRTASPRHSHLSSRRTRSAGARSAATCGPRSSDHSARCRRRVPCSSRRSCGM